MPRPIFRQAALDRLASPEQLDQLVQFAPPAHWFGLPLLAQAAQRLGRRLLTRPDRSLQGPRVKTPTVLQMEAVECGPASLAMVLGFYGRFVPLEELRVVCGVSRDGSKASNLIKAAHGYGLKAKGFKKEPDDLRSLPLPLIAFWNFNHFVVVEGFGAEQVYLNDPASGRRAVSSDEFDQAFTGIVLVFTPGPEFQAGGMRPTVIRALQHRLAGANRALLAVGLGSLLFLLLGLIIPILTGRFVDDVLAAPGLRNVEALLLGVAFTAVLRAVLLWLQQMYLLRLETRLALNSAQQFFRHLLNLPVAFFAQRSTGDIGTRIALNDRVAQFLWRAGIPTALQVIFVACYLLVMIHYDVVLTLVGVGVAGVAIGLLRLVTYRQDDLHRRLLQDQGRLEGTAYAGLRTIESIKATGGEADFFARWAGYQAKVVNGKQALAASKQVAAVGSLLLLAGPSIAVLLLGALRVMEGHLTIGMLVAVHSLLLGLLQPLRRLMVLEGELQGVTADIHRLDDIMCYPPDPSAGNKAGTALTINGESRLTGQLELRNLTFGYSRMDPPLIENLSLVVQQGQRIALVGGSGSGKSTVAKLVAGLYEPWSGELLFDGQPRAALPRTVITASLALVDQDIFLFAGTVRENITLWDASIPLPAVEQAAHDAAVHGEIVARAGGYERVIDEGGRDLSGGQRQRLEFARALLGNPTILVLDEATSALDPLTEQLIGENLRRRGCTCIIVAHRLSTIRDADEILVLEQGKVVQRGSHVELSQLAGPYARLIAAETSAPEEQTVVPPISAQVG